MANGWVKSGDGYNYEVSRDKKGIVWVKYGGMGGKWESTNIYAQDDQKALIVARDHLA